MRYLVHSFVGRRDHNEDAGAAFRAAGSRAPADVLLLSDGMGGAAHGEAVSRAVVETMAGALSTALSNACSTALAGPADDVDGRLAAAVAATQARVEALVCEAGWGRAGATLVACVVHGGTAWYTHLGDSRLYHWDAAARRLSLLTEDHTLPQMLLARGLITADMARTHPLRNQLVRFVGSDERGEVPVARRALRPGDRLLLCSDGVSGRPEADVLAAAFAHDGLDAVAAALFGAAMDAGSGDNMTVVLYEHDGAGEAVEVAFSPGEREARYRADARPAPSPPVFLTPAALFADGEAAGDADGGDTLRDTLRDTLHDTVVT